MRLAKTQSCSIAWRGLFICVAMLLMAFPLQAQRVVTCPSWEILEQRQENGQQIRQLRGNVRCRQDETQLGANLVQQFPARDAVLLQGNVEVFERGDSLFTNRLRYNQRTRVGRALEPVRLTDGEVVVNAPTASYYNEEKRATFTEGVQLVDSVSVLSSDGGEYFSDSKQAELYGRVYLLQEALRLRSDSLTFFRETNLSIARGSVFIDRLVDTDVPVDSSGRTFLFSDYAWYDEPAGSSRLEGNPLLVQLQPDSTGALTDTLVIQSERISIAESDSLQRVTAVASVQIWQRAYAAVADSVVFDRFLRDGTVVREELRLYHNPLMWVERTELSGDTIRVAVREGRVDSLFVDGSGFVAQEDSVIERIHQLRGRTIRGAFTDNALRRLEVGPNAEVIRFLADDGEPNGALRALADGVRFDLNAGELQRVSFIEGVEGTMFPEGTATEPLELQGFRWQPERRPERIVLLEDPRFVAREEAGDLGAWPEETESMPPFVPTSEEESVSPPVQLVPVVNDSEAQQLDDQIDVAAGGYVIVVASEESSNAAEAIRATIATLGYPTGVLPFSVGVITRYRVALGQFFTQAAASAARARLRAQLPPDAWILAL